MRTRITIIGSGPGGYAAALEAVRLGGEVTVIEREATGGTCLNLGCIPTKTWKAAAERFRMIRDAERFGIEVPDGVRLNPERVIARKHAVVDTLARSIHSRFTHRGIRYLGGDASVPDPHHVRVRRPDGEIEDIFGDRLIIATGSSSRPLPFLPFDHEFVISTDDAVELSPLPASLLVVGGGASGCEFASIFSALGTRVTLVETFPHLLPGSAIDRDSVAVLQREMKKRGVILLTGHTVERADRSGGNMRVVLAETGKAGSGTHPIDVAKILVTAGRIPASGGLDRMEIARDRNGWVLVNGRMETNVRDVYAVGDILGPARIMLAHVAAAEGAVAARNAMGEARTMDYAVIPTGVFTTPEVASVGLTEEEARAGEPEARTITVPFRALGMAHAMGEIEGQVKLVARHNGKLLGIHIVGPHATELIAEGALAVERHVTASDLAATVHMHPTLAETIREAAEELAEEAGKRTPDK